MFQGKTDQIDQLPEQAEELEEEVIINRATEP
jgi:hypothetical protein